MANSEELFDDGHSNSGAGLNEKIVFLFHQMTKKRKQWHLMLEESSMGI